MAPDVDKSLQQRRQEIANWRATKVDFDPVIVPDAPYATFTLVEEGLNPDVPLAQAVERMNQMYAAIAAGNDDKAWSLRDVAFSVAYTARDLVKRTHSAKKMVEAQAPNLRSEFADYAAFEEVSRVYVQQEFAHAVAIIEALETLKALPARDVAVGASVSDHVSAITPPTADKANQASSAVKAALAAFRNAPFVFANAQEAFIAADVALKAAEGGITNDLKLLEEAKTAWFRFMEAYRDLNVAISNIGATEPVRKRFIKVGLELQAVKDAVDFVSPTPMDWSLVIVQAQDGKAEAVEVKRLANQEFYARMERKAIALAAA